MAVKIGKGGDIPTPYDFFNEGRTRIAVYRPSDGVFDIKGLGMKDWADSTGNMILPFKKNKLPVNIWSNFNYLDRD